MSDSLVPMEKFRFSETILLIKPEHNQRIRLKHVHRLVKPRFDLFLKRTVAVGIDRRY